MVPNRRAVAKDRMPPRGRNINYVEDEALTSLVYAADRTVMQSERKRILGEAQGRSGLGVRRAGGAGDMGDHFAADDGQPDRRAEPRGMADQLPAGHAPRIALSGHLVTTTVPCMNGWIEQM